MLMPSPSSSVSMYSMPRRGSAPPPPMLTICGGIVSERLFEGGGAKGVTRASRSSSRSDEVDDFVQALAATEFLSRLGTAT